LLVIPLCVIMGWVIDQPLDLNLHVFETTTFVMTVLTTIAIVQVGLSWPQSTLVILIVDATACFLSRGVIRNVKPNKLPLLRSLRTASQTLLKLVLDVELKPYCFNGLASLSLTTTITHHRQQGPVC
jgi:hypothetical protein